MLRVLFIFAICLKLNVANDFILFTDTLRRNIFSMNLTGGPHNALPMSGHVNPIAVDYDPVNQHVFWTERNGGQNADTGPKFIYRYSLTSNDIKSVELPRSSIPDGLGMDYISKVLYYSDAGNNIIGAMDPDLTVEVTLINTDLDEPRGIALDPLAGFMYWTDWGTNAKIEKAHMDGTNRVKVVDTGLGWPNGISVDPSGGRLYWCDAKMQRIESSDLNGGLREVLLHEFNAHYFGIDVGNTYMYFTDWRQSAIQRAFKNGSGHESLGDSVFSITGVRMNGIAVHQVASQIIGSNGCSDNNGDCSHICVATPSGRTCLCPDGWKLGSDGRDCSAGSFKTSLLYVDHGRRGLFQYDLDLDLSRRLPVKGHGLPYGIAYDAAEKKVFWTDRGYKRVVMLCLDGSTITCTSVHPRLQNLGLMVGAIAVDEQSQFLYIAHDSASEAELGGIIRMTYEGQTRITMVSNANKYTSLSFGRDRYLYWTEQGATEGSIKRMNVTNGQVTTLISALSQPTALKVISQEDTMYWAEGPHVRTSSLSATNRRTVYTDNAIITSLDVDGQHLYITQSKQVFRISRTDGSGRVNLGVAQYQKLTDILYFPGYNGGTIKNEVTMATETTISTAAETTSIASIAHAPNNLGGPLLIGGIVVAGVIIAVTVIVVGCVLYKRLDVRSRREAAESSDRYVYAVSGGVMKDQPPTYEEVTDYTYASPIVNPYHLPQITPDADDYHTLYEETREPIQQTTEYEVFTHVNSH